MDYTDCIICGEKYSAFYGFSWDWPEEPEELPSEPERPEEI